jgi:hypothetical protein
VCLTELFSRAGLENVDVTAIDMATPFASFDDYWQPFLSGQKAAPAVMEALMRKPLCTHLTRAGSAG